MAGTSTLDPIADDIWHARSELKTVGVVFPLRMTVVRLSTGSVWVHAPFKIGDELAAAIEALGPVRHIVAPNCFHHLYAAAAKRRWPEAVLWAAPGLARKRKDVTFDATLGDEPPPAWAADLDQRALHGAPAFGEVDFLHRASKTLIATDLLFNIHESESLLTRLVMRSVGAWQKPAQSRLVRLVTKDKAAMRASVARVLEWEFERVLMAHGEALEGDAPARLREALAYWVG